MLAHTTAAHAPPHEHEVKETSLCSARLIYVLVPACAIIALIIVAMLPV